ncbi:LTA synthase family protein [Dysgonomonas sp. 25]|uniref:LTA synthase family protein n=1 Tax=Dysgonomonas sp. 25 TaxID=2302933 RepID=UPI0013D4E71F|nr:LTA synthase family protein [Dysgonomonas sp. 25]NDV67995.1 LTA synthase family protein [Dysgonomonas sp. 25]
MKTSHVAQKLAFLKPLFCFFLIGLLLMSLSRFVLFLIYVDRVGQVADYWLIFPLGLRTDIIMMSYLSFIPVVFLLLIPDSWSAFLNKFMNIYCCFFLILILFMELATPQFIDQYDTRPNKLFLEYLIYPKEIFTMLLKARPGSIILIVLVLAVVIFAAVKWGRKLFYRKPSSYKLRLALLPLFAFLLFWGARGSLTTRRPINASNAVFSNDQLTNTLGLNSTYTLLYAAYSLKNEASVQKMYGKMSEKEAYARVKKYMDVPEENFLDPEIPFLHVDRPDTVLQRPYNLVIFLQESLGAEYIGCLGGMPLTPNLDRLSEEGILFTNLYATGTRSVRGIEAVMTGFLPSPSESVVKLSGSQIDFAITSAILEEDGYTSSFIYGGMANFDNMGSFFSGNGVDYIIDETSFDKDGNTYAMKGTWGYSDEDLVTKANEFFKSMGDKPFFSLMFSSSNHEPFEFPDDRIELYEQPKNTVHNAMKYADYAIGKFFELAQKEDYYKNTIFVIVADHNTRTYGKNLVPINKFRIPALIIGPGVSKGVRYDKLCSQIDLSPTVLDMLGITVEHPMVGRNLRHLPDSVPGRAIMQFYDINAFRVEDEVVILQPDKEPLQFHVANDTTLTPMALDTTLARDALGHVVAAEYLYKHKKHRLGRWGLNVPEKDK